MGKAGEVGELALIGAEDKVTFDVSVNGRPWKVAVEAAELAGRFDVIVKGRNRTFDVAWIDAATFSLIDGGQHAVAREVGIERGQPGDIRVMIEGKSFQVVLEKRAVEEKRSRVPFSQDAGKKKAPDPFTAPTGSNGEQRILAPMPGRVVRVLVAPGDKVAAGQAVVVMEAMKMENELRSPKAGVVREVAVVEGAAIDTGTVVVVIE